MINKINSTSFKGILRFPTTNERGECVNYLKYSVIDTDKIKKISNKSDYGYTEILTKESDGTSRMYYVPKMKAPFQDVVAAYTAACLNDDVEVDM